MADSTRGHLKPRIVEVMAYMNAVCPAYIYPADSGRAETLAPNNGAWFLGGTSPSGDDDGDVTQANWWIGERYVDGAFNGAPQRMVWIPPRDGEERFAEADSVGHHKVGDAAGQTFGAGDDRLPASMAYRKVMSRVVPVKVDIWGNDFDDTDLMVHWLASCIFATNAGAPEKLREKTISSGGYVTLEKGQRGVRYRLSATFVFPIIAPFVQGAAGSADAFKALVISTNVRPVPSAEVVQLQNQPTLSDDQINSSANVAPPRGPQVPSDLDQSPWIGPNAPLFPSKIWPK